MDICDIVSYPILMPEEPDRLNQTITSDLRRLFITLVISCVAFAALTIIESNTNFLSQRVSLGQAGESSSTEAVLAPPTEASAGEPALSEDSDPTEAEE